MPAMVDMQVSIGASGAPTLSSSTGPSSSAGVQSITRLAAGIYQIQLKDNYSALLGMDANMIEAATGSAIDPNAGATGSLYQISTVGNTDWVTAGLSASITPAIGSVLVLAAAPASGTGRVKLVTASGTASIELAGQMMNSNNPALGGPISGTNGARIVIQTLQAQVGSAATQGAPIQYAAADPVSGTSMQIRLYLNNSSVQ